MKDIPFKTLILFIIAFLVTGCGSTLRGLKIEVDEFQSYNDPNNKVERVVYLQEFA